MLALPLGLDVVSGKSERYRLGRCGSAGLSAHRTEEGTGQSAAAAAGGDGVLMLSRPPPLGSSLSDRLVVFHRFFQSSIDRGLCTSEARALWRWLRRRPDRKTLSHDSGVRGHTKREAFVGGPCCF